MSNAYVHSCMYVLSVCEVWITIEYFQYEIDVEREQTAKKKKLINTFINALHRGKADTKTKKAAFRQHYGRIGEIRSLLPPSTPVVVMTATATNHAEREIANIVGMKKYHRIALSPNKENIRYSVISLPVFNLYTCMKPIIKDIEVNGINAERVIVYCRKKGHCSDLFELFTECLGIAGYHQYEVDAVNDDRNRLFAMFHSKTDDDVKSTVLKSFTEEKGHIRILFCTIAFGMGIDVKGLHEILHLGPSSEIEDYLQESGRAGRDGQQSFATVLKYPHSTSGNVGQGMKDYVNETSECRRKILLQPFDASSDCNGDLHNCCDNCSKKCRCLCKCKSSCSCENVCINENNYLSRSEISIKNILSKTPEHENIPVCHDISPTQRLSLQTALLEYRSSILSPDKKMFAGVDLCTGYTRQLVDSIVSKVQYIGSPAVLEMQFTFFNKKHVLDTWDIICSVLEEYNSSLDSSESNSDSGICLGMSGYRRLRIESSSSDTC